MENAPSAATGSPRSWFPPLLRERLFRRFWLGQTISHFGDQVSGIALPLVGVLALDASPAQMGYLGAAGVAPNLLVSLHAGAFVDRHGRRRQTMIVADAGRALLLATIPIAYWLDALTFAHLYGVAFLTGVLTVFFFVSYNTLFVSLVPRERYVDGNSLLNGSRAFSFVAGPSAGGLLVQLISAPFTLLADALSFVASALYLRSIDPVEPPTAEPAPGQLTEGLRFIRRSPTLLAKLAATATINFFNFLFFALFILYVTRELGVSPALLGLILGAGAVGGLVGSVAAGRITRRLGIGPAFVLGCVLFPAPFLLVPLAGGPRPLVLALLFVFEFGTGFGVMLLDITGGAIQQALVPDRLRARVSGAYMVVNFGVRPLGALAGGVLGTAIGLRPSLWVAAVGGVAGVLFLLASPIPRMRELPNAVDVDGEVRLERVTWA
jgi:MFS family permease